MKVAKRFDSTRTEKRHREFVLFTGTHKKLELSVLATGIGEDNTEIAVIEAVQITKNPTFIRCGSCSSLQPGPKLGDLILSRGSVRLGNTSLYYVSEGYPAIADSDVLLALGTACQTLHLPFHVGITACAPGFYGAQGRELPGFPLRDPELPERLAKMNVLNFEMETATLFSLASLRGLRAGAICAVYGNRPRDEFADEPMRAKAEEHCIEATLEAFHQLAQMDEEQKSAGTPLWLPTNRK